MGSNILSYWGVSLWGEARWACYQATWGNAVWGESLWGFIWSDNFFEVLAAMEKVNVSENPWPVDMWVPGMWEQNSKAREVIRNLEK
jgi:hypothetical protein